MVINGQNLAILHTALSTAFTAGLQAVQPVWGEIAMAVPSSGAQNVYPWLADNATIREWIGDRRLQNLAQMDYTLKNKTFEGTLTILRDEVEDDQYGIKKVNAEMLGRKARLLPDSLLFKLMVAAQSTVCYDGQYFFDTDHPVGKEGSYTSASNYITGSGPAWYLLDTSQPIRPFIVQQRREFHFVSKDKPDDDNTFMRNQYLYGTDGRLNVGLGMWQLAVCSKADLTAENFYAAKQLLEGRKNDAGEPLDLRATTIVVPKGLSGVADEVFKPERNAAGATNLLRNVVKIIDTAWLPDA